MKWAKYLYRTPMAQIRADLAEYINLRRQCVSLRDAQRSAQERIVKLVNGDEDPYRKEISCVCHNYYFRPCTNFDDIGDGTINMHYSICKQFDNDKHTEKCTKINCPCIPYNHGYIDACVRLNAMRQSCRDFWRNKFAQACQNVK